MVLVWKVHFYIFYHFDFILIGIDVRRNPKSSLIFNIFYSQFYKLTVSQQFFNSSIEVIFTSKLFLSGNQNQFFSCHRCLLNCAVTQLQDSSTSSTESIFLIASQEFSKGIFHVPIKFTCFHKQITPVRQSK